MSDYTDKRKRVEAFFKIENRISESEQVYESPSGRYMLKVVRYQTKEGGWRYSQGTVTDRAGNVVGIVRRNYGSFPFTFVEDHPDGHDYLFCGEDYQGQTVLQLDTGDRRDYYPDSAEKGFGFCWAAHSASPDKTLLAVTGCYWACPYEVRVYDISDPMNFPLPCLMRDYDYDDFDGDAAWSEDNELTYYREYEVVTYFGDERREHELTEEEEDVIEQLLSNESMPDEEYDKIFSNKRAFASWGRGMESPMEIPS